MRVREHMANIRKVKKEHSVPKHFRMAHNKDPSGVKFWGIEKATKHRRRGNYIRQMSKRESFWIYETKVLAPLGMNLDFDLNCFISDK